MINPKEIYFDNNATTPIATEVFDAMVPFLKENYGNPSSLHRKGVIAERAVQEARRQLAEIFRVESYEILFTSGGSESDNLAIKGIAQALRKKGRHIITVATEHEAVLACCKQLQLEGFEISYVPTDSFGHVSAQAVCAHIREDTILVAIMHVNNELGTINPISQIAKEIKNLHPRVLIFSDGAQAFGKMEIDLQYIDSYSLSGHKIHAPKGVGALFIKHTIPLSPLIAGGGQEYKKRSGTENVAGIVALATAAKLAYDRLHENRKHLQFLKTEFLQKLQNTSVTVTINSPTTGLENVLNISFLGIPSEIMMHSLEQKGIYVSAGSACMGGKGQPSYVLKAVGLSQQQIQSAIRFSFSRYNTIEEINYAIEAIIKINEELKFIRK